MPSIKELREQRSTLADEAKAILTAADERGDSLSGEDATKFDRMHVDIETLGEDIQRREVQEQLDKSLAAQQVDERHVGSEDEEGTISLRDRKKAFRSWFLSGSNIPVGTEGRQAADKCGIDLANKYLRFSLNSEARAQDTSTTTKGVEVIPEGFVDRLEVAMKSFGGMRQAAQTLRTATGNPLPMPTVNDTAQVAEIVGENTGVNNQDVTFGQLTLGAYTYNSKLVPVSVELLQDEAVNLETYLGDALGMRLGRGTNAHFTTGTGTGQPNGVVTAAPVGKTAAVNSAITYAELVDLQHSVDPAYRAESIFMFNDTTLATLKKLLGTDGRPLWAPGIATGAPDTLLGHKFVINQDVASIGTVATPVLFGDFSKYLIREVTGVELLRLDERFAELHQVAFVAFWRGDGDLLDAGTNPIKSLKMPL